VIAQLEWTSQGDKSPTAMSWAAFCCVGLQLNNRWDQTWMGGAAMLQKTEVAAGAIY
jgi:hypothetical protein